MGELHEFGFRRAFDKILHQEIICNLGGLKVEIKVWMKGYLNGRELKTLFRDKKNQNGGG